MLHQLLGITPQQPSAPLALFALGGAALGGFLWLAGSRFSQGLVTLMAVAVGAWGGLCLPRWLLLPIAPWATAVGGALVLGLLGYGMHRMFVGLGLALVLALWVGLTVIAQHQLLDRFPAPAMPLVLSAWLQQVWDAVPQELRRSGPLGCGMAAVAGLGVAVIWPRLAGYLFYSLLGVSLMVGLAMEAMVLGSRPQLLRIVPADPHIQLAVLAALVVFGAAVQWRTAPRKAVSKPAQKPKDGQG